MGLVHPVSCSDLPCGSLMVFDEVTSAKVRRVRARDSRRGLFKQGTRWDRSCSQLSRGHKLLNRPDMLRPARWSHPPQVSPNTRRQGKTRSVSLTSASPPLLEGDEGIRGLGKKKCVHGSRTAHTEGAVERPARYHQPHRRPGEGSEPFCHSIELQSRYSQSLRPLRLDGHSTALVESTSALILC